MSISKRDLEVAALSWKVRAENTQKRVEELEHALNLLANDSVEWFAHHQTSDGAHHDFGIAVAFEVPISDSISRVVRGADVENLPLIFWRTTWPEGGKFMTVNSPKGFVALKKVGAGTGRGRTAERGIGGSDPERGRSMGRCSSSLSSRT